MLRRLIVLALVFSVVGIAANDVVRYGVARISLREDTFELNTFAVANVRGLPRTEAARQVAEKAAVTGVTVYQYGQTEEAIQIWTRTEVPKTIVARTLLNMLEGMSFREARKQPLTISDYRESRFM